MPAEDQPSAPTWRSFRKRVGHVTVEELRLLFDWSLPGPRLYQLSEDDRFYIVAKVVVETDEPVYPCRPSEHREVSGGGAYHVKQEVVNAVTQLLKHVKEREAWRKYEEFRAALEGIESKTLEECLSTEERELVRRIWSRISLRAGNPSGAGKHNWEHVAVRVRREFPCWDESKWTYPTGRFTTWLATDEVRNALAHDRLIQCHEVFFAVINVEHNRRWQKLRNQMFRLFGRTCMRCGCTTGEMHIDHIKPWSRAPEQRYDPENLQVLCRECHAWKEAQGTEMNFRPDVRPDR